MYLRSYDLAQSGSSNHMLITNQIHSLLYKLDIKVYCCLIYANTRANIRLCT